MKIAITTSSFAQYSEEPLWLLAEKGLDAVINPHGRVLTEEESIKILNGCVGLIAGTEILSSRVMDAAPDLKIISRCGTGMDNIDLETAKARKIIVCNTPDAPTQAVVELVLAMALDLARKLSNMDRDMRGGIWKKRMGNLLIGKKVGIIGFGRIGKAVGKTFSILGCPVGFYDPYIKEKEIQLGALSCQTARKMSLEELLPWAELISLHCPKPENSQALIGDAELKSMGKGAWLINAARGGLVDEASLYAALNIKHLGGAALDVYTKEPYTGPLMELNNIILTPHVGSYAMESRIKMEIESVKNLLEMLPE